MSINCSDVEQFPPLVSPVSKQSTTTTKNSVSDVLVGTAVIGGPSVDDVQKTKNVNEIVGANPPVEVVDGFIKRIWGNLPIDKVSFLPNGVFLVRFTMKAAKDRVLQQGHYLFDNKPLIVHPWSPDVELTKDDVKEVPFWVRLEHLPLKFWGKCLSRIAGLLGKFVQMDVATKDKTRLGFARVMLEVPFGKPLPASVKFMDEDGVVVTIKVVWEWKPLLCKHFSWERNGKYHVAQTPAKKIIRFSRQELIDKGQSSEKFGNDTLLESLNTATPVTGIGVGVMYNFGFWNIRGLDSPSKQNNIKRFLHHHQIGLFSLLETKVKSLSLNNVRNNLCASWSLSTNTSYHKGGRIWMLWNPSMFSVNFLDYSSQAIHMKVKNLGTGYSFFCTIVYAFNDVNARKALWSDLGGKSTFEEMDDFQRCVSDFGVTDCPAIGSYYTWANKQEPSSRVFSRLDRMLVNSSWLQDNASAYAHFYTEGTFDHTPCVVQTLGDFDKPIRSFKYYNMWSKAAEVKTCVSLTWAKYWDGSHMFNLVKKLKSLKWPLKQLNKDNFDDIVNTTAKA
ncbi:uncharacterized protein LOC141619622 [Silene latifolia]|uniref:uncharacterized protein LOC141619622 n=1 Tax=Silene latifolia TaxID=37657 RepID=UPI003D784F95